MPKNKGRGVKRAAKVQERTKARKGRKVAPAKAPVPPVVPVQSRKRHFAAPVLPDLSAKIIEPVLPPEATEPEREARKLMSLNHESLVPMLASAPDLSDEEKAMLEARAFCQNFLRRNDDALHLLGSLIAVRQTYAVFYRELQELLEKERAEGREVPTMAEDYIILSAMHKAAEPFSEHDLMQGFVDTVLPHIADVVDRHAKADEEAAQEAEKKEYEERGTRPLPVGFRVDLESEDEGWPRDRSLVLLGWENAVLFVLDQITNSLLVHRDKAPVQIVRFRETAPKDHDVIDLLIDLPPNQWHGCCNSEKALATCMGVYVLDRQVRLADVLIFDDLSQAYTKGFVGRPAGANAGDAHKFARRWASKGGAGLIAGLPLPEPGEPDRLAPEYEQLRTFATIRAVHVLEEAPDLDPAHYRVSVGTSLHRWDVAKEVLAAYGRATIISPGN